MDNNSLGHRKKSADSKVVILDAKADIVAAIEAVRFNKEEHVLLTLPEQPEAFRRYFDLRLLKQISLAAGKEITLVTTDKAVIRLADRLGIAFEHQLEEYTMLTEDEPPPKIIKDSSREVPPLKTPRAQVDGFQTASSDISPVPPLKFVDKPAVALPKKKKATRRSIIDLALIILLIGGALIAAYIFWPHQAEINIRTDVSKLRVNVQADLSQVIQNVDSRRKVLPLKMFDHESRLREEVEATGATNGIKSNGVLEIYNCSTDNELVIDTQTIFRKEDKDFVLVLPPDSSEIVVPPIDDANDCENPSASIEKINPKVEAVEAGEEYDFELGSYQIVGLDEDHYSARGIYITQPGQGIAACVTEEDLEAARERLDQTRDDKEAKRQLLDRLEFEEGLIPLEATFQTAKGEIFEPPTCPEATDTTINQLLIYWMGGVSMEDLDELIQPDLAKAGGDLTIVDNGLSTADYEVHVHLDGKQPEATVNQPADLDYYIIIDVTQAAASIILDDASILKQIAGSKAKQVAARLRRLEGVQNVEIEISPFWSVYLPDDESAIILNIDNQSGVKNNLNDSSNEN